MSTLKKIYRNKMRRLLVSMILLFFIGAITGWLYEAILHLFTSNMFVNRGMLHGPWLPIYGVGCVLIVVLKNTVGNNPLRFLIVSIGACAVLEYITSWLLETIYHVRWWDYSNSLMNLNGRIYVGAYLVLVWRVVCFHTYFCLYLKKYLLKFLLALKT